MYFYEEYYQYNNISNESTCEEFEEKMKIAEKVIYRLINAIGTTAFEYMGERDKNFCRECYEMIKMELF